MGKMIIGFACLVLAGCDYGPDARVSQSPAQNPNPATDGGPSVPIGTIAVECVEPDQCVNDSDCVGDTRCNLAIQPPQCQQLYCGGMNTWCSEDEFCAHDYTCVESRCAPCDDCGDACVSLQNDPAHCGQCNRSVGDGQICENGSFVCTDSEKSTCGDDCIDLSKDENHCGACGQKCIEGASCKNGLCTGFASTSMTDPGVPVPCETVCREEQQSSCTVRQDFPLHLFVPGTPTRTMRSAGVAVYKRPNEAVRAYSPVLDCDDVPPEIAGEHPFFALVCACKSD
jgi:hypothetical protein